MNEGDEIKKIALFKKKIMRATEKTSKKNIDGKIFLSFEMNLVFFRNVFLSPEIDCLFGNRQQSNACAGQKKTHVFFVMRGLNLMRALI